jgi:hypothetical protein
MLGFKKILHNKRIRQLSHNKSRTDAAKKAARISTYPYFCGTLEQQHIFYYYYYYYYLFIYIYQVLTTHSSLSTFSKTHLFRTIRQVSTWNNHGTLEQNSASFSFTPFSLLFTLALPLLCRNYAKTHSSPSTPVTSY